MSNRDRILDFVRRYPGRDDDELALLLHISPRQTVNQICRELAKSGFIERRAGPSGKIANYPLGSLPLPNDSPVRFAKNSPPSPSSDATLDWFWEGNVVDAFGMFFTNAGWEIVSRADTRSRQRGIDVHARRNGRDIVIEVKGYPSVGYRDQRRALEKKTTAPTLQAGHWYSHALLKALRMLQSNPDKIIAIGLPDFPRYRTLIAESSLALARLGLLVMLVDEHGTVTAAAGTLPE